MLEQHVSVSIQAHPTREAGVQYLKAKLGDVAVAYDEKSNVWDTRRRALQLHDEDAEFHLIVQDDAVICADFFPRLEEVLKHGDGLAYSLFYRDKPGVAWPRKAMREAARAGLAQGWFTFPRLQFGVGIVLPTRIIPDLITFVDEIVDTDKQDDLFMNEYLVAHNMETLYPLPSLVDHRHDGESMIGHGPNGNRVARWFVGE